MKYLWLILKHKWFILFTGRKLKCSYWRLFIHDLTKFLPYEFGRYNRNFFGTLRYKHEFAEAWTHHQNYNKHHWEYWIPRTAHYNDKNKNNHPLPMPEKYVREMVADWLAASRSYEGRYPVISSWKWFEQNYFKMKLHEETKATLFKVLEEIGYVLEPPIHNLKSDLVY